MRLEPTFKHTEQQLITVYHIDDDIPAKADTPAIYNTYIMRTIMYTALIIYSHGTIVYILDHLFSS